METARMASGLDGVVAAETRLSEVDGEAGRLVLAGFDVEELAERATFEDVCGLLQDGALPDDAERERIRRSIAEGRVRAFDSLDGSGDALIAGDATAALRTAIAHLGAGAEPDAAALVGAAATFAAAWHRRRKGLPAVAPDASLAVAADYLRMLGGAAPPVAPARALDRYLVTVVDHGMNASTFTARVVASTGSDRVSAVVAAIGALKGPLHGGAPGPVLDMLDAVAVLAGGADAEVAARRFVDGELAAGRRIMGVGHRVYRVRDPRAAVLEAALAELEGSGVATGDRLALARAVERVATRVLAARHTSRPLHANVEFYTAVLLEAVGVPRELFTATFAVGRTAGWCAHIDEQRRSGRLIRPASRYVGPTPRPTAA